MMDDNREPITQYMYMNRFAIPFLKHICDKFEVIIYSRIRTTILTQIMKQIKSMACEIKFSVVIGANSCANVRLVSDKESCKNPGLACL